MPTFGAQNTNSNDENVQLKPQCTIQYLKSHMLSYSVLFCTDIVGCWLRPCTNPNDPMKAGVRLGIQLSCILRLLPSLSNHNIYQMNLRVQRVMQEISLSAWCQRFASHDLSAKDVTLGGEKELWR